MGDRIIPRPIDSGEFITERNFFCRYFIHEVCDAPQAGFPFRTIVTYGSGHPIKRFHATEDAAQAHISAIK